MAYERIQLWDGTNVVSIDSMSRSLPIIDHEQYFLHQGNAYFLTESTIVAGTGTALNVSITTPGSSKLIHFLYSVGVLNQTELSFLEGVSIAAGVTHPVFNNNRNPSNLTSAIIKFGVSMTGGGVTINAHNIGAGKGSDSTTRDQNEIILKPNNNYVLSIVNDVTGNNNVDVDLHWYEVNN